MVNFVNLLAGFGHLGFSGVPAKVFIGKKLTIGADSGTRLALPDRMDCYFGSYDLPPECELDKTAVVLFAIPELGIKFKAPFNGVDHDHNDFASLLALLEFIDSNQKYFSNNTYQIFGNNHKIINQVNKREQAPLKFTPLMQKALNYREKYRFSLGWVKPDDNPVYQSLFD